MDSCFDDSKELLKIREDVQKTIEVKLKTKNVLIELSAQKNEEPGKGLKSGADILILTGLNFTYFDPKNKEWVGEKDDLVFNSMLPPIVIVCLKYNAKETGKMKLLTPE